MEFCSLGATEITDETFPATGRPMNIKGQIVAERQYWNLVELLAQVGMFTFVLEG